jgi:hypothetical protein
MQRRMKAAQDGWMQRNAADGRSLPTFASCKRYLARLKLE